MRVGENQGYRVPGTGDPTGCIEFRVAASSSTFWCPLSFPLSLSLSLFLERYSSAFFTLGRRRRTENYRRYLDRTRYRALCLLKENRVVRINLCVYVCMYMYNGIIEEVVQCTLFSKIKPLGLRYVECS